MTIVYEHPESRREALTASGELITRADAEAQGYTIAPYVDLVAPAARIAVEHAEHADLVRLPPFGMLITAASAKAIGFAVSKVAAAPRASVAPSQPNPDRAWRAAIIQSPEANARPSAAAELLSTQKPDTMSVDQARAFLRALPIEKEETVTKTENDPRAARLAEIGASVSAFNHQRGYAAKPKAAPALNSGDSANLQRLAEIRLGVLSMRLNHGDSAAASEHRKLSYALSVHAETGSPLATVFKTIGIDTSKMLNAGV